MKKTTTRVTIVFICMIVALIGYYTYLSNKRREARADAAMTVVQEALNRDLQNDYPATPKEVIKYYNEILKCFYNEECTNEEIEALGQRARDLYDDELLEANDLGVYMIKLQEDVKEYKDRNRRIASIAVAASTNVYYFEQDGYSFARIACGYTIMEDSTSNPMTQVYLLRKDDRNRWKIYGWEEASKLQE